MLEGKIYSTDALSPETLRFAMIGRSSYYCNLAIMLIKGRRNLMKGPLGEKTGGTVEEEENIRILNDVGRSLPRYWQNFDAVKS